MKDVLALDKKLNPSDDEFVVYYVRPDKNYEKWALWMWAVPGGDGGAAPAAEEKTEFDVVLVGFDAAQKIKVIKSVREITGLGLAEAKKAVEETPTTLKEALSKEDAENMKKELEEVGAKIELK